MAVQFKPRDVVSTPEGRVATVAEILPGRWRRVEFNDRRGGEAVFMVSQLSLIQAGSVVPWKTRRMP